MGIHWVIQMETEVANTCTELSPEAKRVSDELLALFCIAGGFDIFPINDERVKMASENPDAVRRLIGAIEQGMRKACEDGILEETDFPLTHSFSKGLYAREMFIPKGSLIVGKIHKKECLNIVSKGDIYVVTETGSMRVTAPYSVVSPAGLRRVGYALEDTVWTNVFSTNETDLEKLEEELIWPSYEAMEVITGCNTAPILEGK